MREACPCSNGSFTPCYRLGFEDAVSTATPESVFHPYPKVAQEPSEWGLDEAQLRATARWVANEKVHGAHLCVCVTPDELQLAKRRALLEPSDSFFGCRDAVGPLWSERGSVFCGGWQPAPAEPWSLPHRWCAGEALRAIQDLGGHPPARALRRPIRPVRAVGVLRGGDFT